MSTTTLNTKFKLRRDLETNWTTANPILADGEPVLSKVEGVYKLKIGDGVTTFSNLPYYGGGSSDADWETLLNKPFYEQQITAQNITINYEDDPNLSEELEGGAIIEAYKISDEYFVDELLNNFIIDYSVQVGASEPQLEEDVLISNLTINHDPTVTTVILPSLGNTPVLLSVASNNTIIDGIEIAEKGTYGLRLYAEGSMEVKLISCSIPTHTILKQIDKKYIDYNWDNITNKPFYDIPLSDYELIMPDNPDSEDIICLDKEDYYRVRAYNVFNINEELDLDEFNYVFNNNGTIQSGTISTSSFSGGTHNGLYVMSYSGNDNTYIYFIPVDSLGNNTTEWSLPFNSNYKLTFDSTGIYIVLVDHYYPDSEGDGIFIDKVYAYTELSYTLEGTTYTPITTSTTPDIIIEGLPEIRELVRVSEIPIDKNDLTKATIVLKYIENGTTMTQSISDDVFKTVQGFNFIDIIESLGGNSFIFDVDYEIYNIAEDNFDLEGLTFDRGVYFYRRIDYEDFSSETTPVPRIQEIYSLSRQDQSIPSPLDKKYIQISWDNIIDQPFGEVNSPNISLIGPTNYDSFINTEQFDFSETVGMIFYRLGDYIDPSLLEGKSESATITSCYYDKYDGEDAELQFIGRSNWNKNYLQDLGSFSAYIDENNLLLFVPQDNTDLNGAGILDSGTYAPIIIDSVDKTVNETTIEGTKYTYVVAIFKENEQYIKTLDPKYIAGIDYNSLANIPLGSGKTKSFNYGDSDFRLENLELFYSDYYYASRVINISSISELMSLYFYYGLFDSNSTSNQEGYFVYENGSSTLTLKVCTDYYGHTYYAFYRPDGEFEYPDAIYIPNNNNDDGNSFYATIGKNNSQTLSGSSCYGKLFLLRKYDSASEKYYGFYALGSNSNNDYIIKLDSKYLNESDNNNNNTPTFELSEYSRVSSKKTYNLNNYGSFTIEGYGTHPFKLNEDDEYWYASGLENDNNKSFAKITFNLTQNCNIYVYTAQKSSNHWIVSEIDSTPLTDSGGGGSSSQSWEVDDVFSYNISTGTHYLYIEHQQSPGNAEDYAYFYLDCKSDTIKTETEPTLKEYIINLINDTITSADGEGF